MSATIIDGKAVSARVRAEVADDVAQLREETGTVPGLATILVGEDPASAIYVANKRKACAEAGIADLHQHLDGDVSQDEVAAMIEECNENPEVSGILLQLPVPRRAGRRRAHRTHQPAEGRRWADADQRRPARAGQDRPAAVHAARRDRTS